MITLDSLKQEATTMTQWQRHRFFVLIALVILIASIMVGVGLSLYKHSGAEQVDLSRPGYQSIRKEAQRGEDVHDAFPATGLLDEAAFISFYDRYDKRSARVVDIESFDEKALSESSLQLLLSDTPAQ